MILIEMFVKYDEMNNCVASTVNINVLPHLIRQLFFPKSLFIGLITCKNRR